MDYSPPGSSALGILQKGILEWVAIPFSRGSSRLRDELASVASPALADRFFTISASAPMVIDLITCFLYQTRCPLKPRDWSHSSSEPWHLEECQVHGRCPVNHCCMNEWNVVLSRLLHLSLSLRLFFCKTRAVARMKWGGGFRVGFTNPGPDIWHRFCP